MFQQIKNERQLFIVCEIVKLNSNWLSKQEAIKWFVSCLQIFYLKRKLFHAKNLFQCQHQKVIDNFAKNAVLIGDFPAILQGLIQQWKNWKFLN